MNQRNNIIVVGAGVSGLVAALELEKAGFEPVIIERSGEIGGRLKTVYKEGWPLDLGFQVVLTAYPAVREYLDLRALDPIYFRPGAAIYRGGEQGLLGDPFRSPGLAWPTLSNAALTLKDKWLTFKLQRELKRRSISEIFREEERDTRSWLYEYGFSEAAVAYFYRPFFSGIFLERELATSSRMFRFVYKMFAEGLALVPRGGIQQVARQLADQLVRTRFRFHTGVTGVRDGSVTLADGTQLEADGIILAFGGDRIPQTGLPRSAGDGPVHWNQCRVIYAWIDAPVPHPGLIGLSASPTVVNNWHEVPAPLNLPEGSGRRLLSMTVPGPAIGTDEQLYAQLREEMKALAGIELQGLLAGFTIDRALPVVPVCTDRYDSRVPDMDRVWRCGDHLYFPSLQAAMDSGRLAARDCIAAFRHLS